MSEHARWSALRDKRMREPGAQEAYESARIAYEVGRTTRQLREDRGWTQADLARAARMTQSAVARFEAGGTVPTLPVLHRVARALDAELTVRLSARGSARPPATSSA
jgi:ribosome-binding protein aMBF1 (putative translation factor)